MSEGTRWFARPYAWLIAAFALYLATFAAFASPWLGHMGSVIPKFPYRPDEELMVWTLSWVTHALVDPHARVFDANIYHPAPAQLTGSENLFFLQVLFAPLYLLTKRPLLATAIVTFLTYPLAALAMAALLVRLGCSRLVAWICGLAFAVGILRIPLNFHVLQYPNLFLPLAALGAVRARSAPGWKSALWLFAVLLATMLTSYYIAGIVCVALAIWVLADLLTLRPRAVAFVTTVALALLAAVGVAAIVLHPYIARSRGMVPNAMPWEHGGQLWLWVQATRKTWDENADYWRLPFAFLAVLGLVGRSDATWRRIALPGALLCLLGTAIVIFGLPDGLGQLAAHTPLRNFRGWVRLLMVTDFGLCLLAAAGLDLCRRRFGKRVALVPIAAFALLAALPRLTILVSAMSRMPTALAEHADAYRMVERYADEVGRGPLLELPTGITTDCGAMLGSTFHWLPLLNGFTGYEPPHVRTMRAASGALPDPAALQDLVDLSHLRWILLRPDRNWPHPRMAAQVRDGLRGSALIGRSYSFDGFTLFEVTASPQRPRWYAAIAAGPSPGTTELGTPVRKLSAAEAIATVDRLGGIEVTGRAKTVALRLRLHNAGTADWPVLESGIRTPFEDVIGRIFGWKAPRFGVYLEVRWEPLLQKAPRREPPVQNVPLDRDVFAGESVVWSFMVRKPPSPGWYWLDVRVVQRDGPELTEPPGRKLRQVVELTPSSVERRARGKKRR